MLVRQFVLLAGAAQFRVGDDGGQSVRRQFDLRHDVDVALGGVLDDLADVLLRVVAAIAVGPFAAEGAEAYHAIEMHLGTWYGQIFLLGFVFSLYLHFCNGVRHLFWDVGYGFELDTVDLTAKLAIALAVVLTVATWVVAGVA